MNFIYLMDTVDQICKTNQDFIQIINVIKSVLTIIQIAVPILLIIMGSIDLMKAVMAGKEDEIKKSQSTFVKRAIAAVIVFFIPFIVSLLLNLINVGQGTSVKDCFDQVKNAGQVQTGER